MKNVAKGLAGKTKNNDVDFFAFAGQSNADGHFFTFEGDNTPGELGSVVFTNTVEQLTGFDPTLVNVASGGAGSSEISNATNFWWNLGQDKPSQLLLDAVANIKAALGQGKNLDGIVWAQGETDALAINDNSGLSEFFAEKLLEATTKTFEYFWSELGSDVPILIQELGENADHHGFDAIRDVQSLLVQQFENVHLGANTEGLAFLSDEIHYTTTSKGTIAKELAETAVSIIGGEDAPTDNPNVTIGTEQGEYLPGTDGDDIINGFGGLDVIGGSTGDDLIRGGDSGYNQVDYDGAVADYKFVRNADGTVTVTKPADTGTDTLVDIEGFWFRGEGVWKPLEDVLDPTSAPPQGKTIIGTAGNDYLAGTIGSDVIDGLDGLDVFGGSKGDDLIRGGDSGYNQVDYDGAVADYKFVRNEDGTVTVTKPAGSGTDTLVDIEGFWFRGEGVWKPLEDVLDASSAPPPGETIIGTTGDDYLIGTAGNDIIDTLSGLDVVRGSKGNDVMTGTAEGYDQVDYIGSLSDYTFTANDDGTVTVAKEGGTQTDTLTDFDGFWFIGEDQYYALDEVLAASDAASDDELI